MPSWSKRFSSSLTKVARIRLVSVHFRFLRRKVFSRTETELKVEGARSVRG